MADMVYFKLLQSESGHKEFCFPFTFFTFYFIKMEFNFYEFTGIVS